MTIGVDGLGAVHVLAPRAAPRRSWAVLAAMGTTAGGIALIALVGFLMVGLVAAPVDWIELVTSPVWDPRTGAFGAAAMIFGTVAVSIIALGIAAPLGRGAAVAITEVVPDGLRVPLRSAAELLAAVPSIVYGLVGIAVVRPFVSGVTGTPGGDSLLAAGIVLAAMVLPTIVAVSVDALDAVPQDIREAARALGLDDHEVISHAVIPAARTGMRAAMLLGLARAMGETVAVFLLIGRADGRLPNPAGVLVALVRPGQTLSTKLGGPEPVLSGGRGAHWAALSALGLLLLGVVALLTATAVGRLGREDTPTVRRRVFSRLRGRAHDQDRLYSPGRTITSKRSSEALGRRHDPGLMRRSQRRRRIRAWVGRAWRLVAVALPAAIAVGIAAVVVNKGTRGLSPSFWWSKAVGSDGGGIRDQLVGTLLITFVAAAIALPIALGLGLATTEFSRPSLGRMLRIALVTLGGIPSILLGLAGYQVLSVGLGWGKSWLIGAMLLSLIIVPVAALTVSARLESVATDEREAAAALGLRHHQVITSVLWPHARVGLVTGVLLGAARAAGETAPLLFAATVFAGAPAFPTGLTDAPVQTLPTHLFALSQDAARPEAVAGAWGSAVVLMVVVATLLLIATPLRSRAGANNVSLAGSVHR